MFRNVPEHKNACGPGVLGSCYEVEHHSCAAIRSHDVACCQMNSKGGLGVALPTYFLLHCDVNGYNSGYDHKHCLLRTVVLRVEGMALHVDVDAVLTIFVTWHFEGVYAPVVSPGEWFFLMPYGSYASTHETKRGSVKLPRMVGVQVGDDGGIERIVYLRCHAAALGQLWGHVHSPELWELRVDAIGLFRYVHVGQGFDKLVKASS
jgi:hypothetical protein